MAKLSPSILSANFDNLLEDIAKIEKGGADYIHCDIMDGKFVPNTTFGPEVLSQISGNFKLPFDVHLMVEHPEEIIKDYVFDQTQYICVHEEACNDIKNVIELIHSFGVKAGLAINPETSIDRVKGYLSDIDLVLVMTVHPGASGQSFIPSAALKICELDEIRRSKALNFKIEVDGGVKLDNCQMLKNSGADIIVTGSACFGAEDVTARCIEFKNLIK